VRVAVVSIGLSLACGIVGSHVGAQQQKKDLLEFTRQSLLIVNFVPGPGADLRLGHRAADGVRSRVGKLVNKREVDVIDGGAVRERLDHAGFSPDTAFSLSDVHGIGMFFRADEYLLANVANTSSGFRLSGELVLVRNAQLRQPLPEVRALRLDSAEQLFAKEVAASRMQLVPERRCENSLREGHGAAAIANARAGIAAYPQSTIARTCLVWALRQTSGPEIPAELLGVSRAVLAIDSTNPHAIEGAAVALDSLRRRNEAADMWLRLASTDTANVDLGLRISNALFDGGNSKRAEPLIMGLVDAHPEDVRLIEQKWHITYENKSWTRAIEAGEALLVGDSSARADSAFYLRLGTAYHEAHRPFKAIETLARGVSLFAGDSRLYSLYAQFVKAEADTVIPRGLALFPQSSSLLALNAKELRARGKLAESLDASKRALAIDSTMAQGQLMVAQLEMELGRPDSALATLRRAIATGEDSSLVAQFALSKGNGLYRAANGTKTSADFTLALRFIAFADTVRSTEQSRFLSGAAALGAVQSALTEATKLKDKAESCRLVHFSTEMMSVARTGLQAGEQSFAEAAKQSIEYLDQLDPYIRQGLTVYCGEGSPRNVTPSPSV
jgi:tetratricopeptide (TPR) repeat protein